MKVLIYCTQDIDESDDSDDDFFPEGVDFYKMVFVVNNELQMGVGKIAAQVAHAALGLHRTMMESPQQFGQMLMSWEQFGWVIFYLWKQFGWVILYLLRNSLGESYFIC